MFDRLKKSTNTSKPSTSTSNNNSNEIPPLDSNAAKQQTKSLFKKSNSSFVPLSSTINNPSIPPQQQQPKSILTQTTDVDSILYLSPIRDQYKQNFARLIKSIQFSDQSLPIALVIDPKIIGLFNLFIDVPFLKINGVEKIYELKNSRLDTECKNIIYVMRPKVRYIYTISDHIRQHLFDYMKKDYSMIYIPRVDPICQRVLEGQGVYGNFRSFHQFHLDLIPFDNDVLSMELPSMYKHFLLDNDKSIIHFIAKSIMHLQSLFGLIPIVKGKGRAAKGVMEMISRMKKDMLTDMPDSLVVSKEIDTLIIIDRQVDFITPLCSPLTYEGLVDEYFSINNNLCLVDQVIMDNASIANASSNNAVNNQNINKKVPFPMHSGDRVYQEIRDKNFSSLMGAGGVLNKKAKQQFDDKKSLTGNESLSALKELMRKVNASQKEEHALRVHVGIAERIYDITSSTYFQNRLDCEQKLLAGVDIFLAEKYLEDCINIKDPLLKVLRILCLSSHTMSGIPIQEYESFKSKIVQTYGCGLLITFNQLEKAGLIHLRKSDGKQSPNTIGNSANGNLSFEYLKEHLNLIIEDIDENNPTDISYVFSGYAPISVRLVQYAMGKGWKQIEDALKLLPGPTFEENQLFSTGSSSKDKDKESTSSFSSNNSSNNNNSNNSNMNNNGNQSLPITFVYYLGGVTFTEISALRFLGQQQKRKYIILTTKLINGDSLLDSFIEA
ncbi:hypothetical protein CYY_009357 [Polysphondylium violaceum]|uniref:Sec1-like family protein n=1 Tax=Polysphondylium violaceum TaxID=133409 RepID=A0A8J4PLY7_9MYCE|nr:hypothetical protein CYY_009357 [Polysphondylium violaceum]